MLRNYEGFITTYTEPDTYAKHDPATCPSCQRSHQREDRQQGVAGLLQGNAMTIEPAGFHETHLRGRSEAGDVIGVDAIGFVQKRAEHH